MIIQIEFYSLEVFQGPLSEMTPLSPLGLYMRPELTFPLFQDSIDVALLVFIILIAILVNYKNQIQHKKGPDSI